MDDNDNVENVNDECVMPPQPLPAQELARYSVERDHHSEADIASYVESQAQDESVQHVEKIKQEIVVGDTYEVWDVTTDKNRWWVITNLTNLYSQKLFPSLDYMLSFHIGLMMRIRSRSDHVSSNAPTPFDEVFRRMEQAENRYDAAVEVEDYQVVGMLLRECLISLAAALRRRTKIPENEKHPQDANFIDWSSLLMNHLCGGNSNKELRRHLKSTARSTWQLVNWLTHARNANRTASLITIRSCQTVVGHYFHILEREQIDSADQCPVCKSRNIRTHFDIAIPPDGDYYLSCGVCDWDSHPGIDECDD